MIELTEEQQNVINKCYELLKSTKGLENFEVGCPIPPRQPK